MSQPEARDDFQLQLGLFVVGALPLDEHLAVEDHLAQCAACRAECDELSEVPALLSLLSDDGIRTLTDEFSPVDQRRQPVSEDPPFAPDSRSAASVRRPQPANRPHRGART
jgi:anti-sigma factor RsiW